MLNLSFEELKTGKVGEALKDQSTLCGATHSCFFQCKADGENAKVQWEEIIEAKAGSLQY